MAREFQLIGYLRLFAERGVEYLLVGGVGARIQGAATTTQDIDIMPEPSPANLERLAQALSDVTTEKKDADATEYRAHPDVDVVMHLPGVGGFDVVRRNARRYEWEGHVISVAELDDIITSKETTDRAKDRRALDALYEARDHLRAHPDEYELSDGALHPEREVGDN